jgi:hypothetical protein
MKKYKIEYKDLDPGCPVFRCIVKAYDIDHAIEKFQSDGDNWEIIGIAQYDKKEKVWI